jgi:Icc-related predicted phosphoesterase
MTELKEYSEVCVKDTNVILSKNKTIYSISDLHLEHYKDMDLMLNKLLFPEANILVLAGDIGDPIKCPSNLIKFLSYVKLKYQHVIMVAGNHEYYGCDKNREKVIPALRILCESTGVHLLDREVKIIEGIRFVGATLWSAIDDKATSILNDFNFAFNHRVEYLEAFITDYQFIKRSLEESLNSIEPVVVITHHLPTNRLIHTRYKDHEANSAFNTNILDLLALHKVKYWFCGHTHEYAETKYGDTKLFVNPLGYPNEIKYTVVKDTVWEVEL